MKKTLLMFAFLGLFVFSACQEKPKPEQVEKTPTMEQVLTETADPNDFTEKPLVGELVSIDMATKGDNAPLATADAVTKSIKDGAMIVFKADNSNYYIVVNKSEFLYSPEMFAPLAGKKIALFGMAKAVNGVNFFIAEKIEESK